VRILLFRWLDLTWELPSGLHLRVASYGDWIIYNEIFVRGEYDQANSIAVGSAADNDSPLHIVDLGANVGFFTLHAVDRLRQRGRASEEFMITAVEGNERCIKEFQARVFAENGLSRSVRLIHGLVGERTGVATFYDNTLFNEGGRSGVRVPYVDLSSLFASSPHIDLLKCDIEGAELLFIENYTDVLRKVRVAVFELHDDKCDTQQCRSLLSKLGFTHQAVLRPGSPCSIYCAWR